MDDLHFAVGYTIVAAIRNQVLTLLVDGASQTAQNDITTMTTDSLT
jgi:hypothetical protein